MTRRSKATSTTSADAGSSASTSFHFVGGKGGVGKTTCAAAMAVLAASRGTPTLIMSIDPAPSLGDALKLSLSHEPKQVRLRRGSLYAVEINAQKALNRWLTPRRGGLERIALRGTWLDEQDVGQLLRLSLPGIDEVAALFEIARLAADRRFARIVVDTAPTGHTLRMLAMPETLRRVAYAFDQMYAKHRVMVQALTGAYAGDEADALIADIDREARDLERLLGDPAVTRMSWVTLPEAMSIEETEDAATELGTRGITLSDVIINRITTRPSGRCRWCETRRRLEAQTVARLHTRLKGVPTIQVGARVTEPRGVRMLAAIGAEIASSRQILAGATRSKSARSVQAVLQSQSKTVDVLTPLETRLLLFGGKGGVGKTTCAAATALSLAAQTSEPVLLLSSDPAHSLADVIGEPIGDVPRRVRGASANLRAREIDATRELAGIRARYRASVDALFDRLVRRGSSSVHVDVTEDRKAMHGLIDLAPPGIDELAAILEVIDALERKKIGTLVIDTAPTGHALRLLAMPEVVHGWTKMLMSILLKYQPVAGLEGLGPALVKLSQGLGRLRQLLTDPAATSFIVVTRAAALPREETFDLLGELHALNIHVPAVLVNAVGRGTCSRCRSEARVERRHINAIRRDVPASTAIILAPAQLPFPHRPDALSRWRRTWTIERAPNRGRA